MIEADGDDALGGRTPCSRCRPLPTARAASAWPRASDDAAREKLWAARKALSPALRTLAPGKINEDVVVPVSRIPALLAPVGAIAAAQSLRIVCFGHAGNGNLHVNILYDPADAGAGARARKRRCRRCSMR